MKNNKWMIYGANGYTGRLIANRAKDNKLTPILAGRNRDAIKALAVECGFEYQVFDLADREALNKALTDMSVVLHCAGPFSATSQPMIESCLANGCHYLDITGEIDVFANAYEHSEEAMRADVVLMPGVGFDVVPTDCLAATLVNALPAATRLVLAFEPGGRVSPGTAKTGVERLASGGCIRKNGKLTQVPLAWKTREIPFKHGKRMAVTIPWGDVFTAHVSTGIPDIEVYLSVPPSVISRMKRLRLIKPLLSMQWLQNTIKKRIERSVSGPDSDERKNNQTQLWGEVSSSDGRCVSATMTTPDGYDLTVTASLGAVQYLLDHDVEGGFYTPSLLLGADYAARLPGVSIDLNV